MKTVDALGLLGILSLISFFDAASFLPAIYARELTSKNFIAPAFILWSIGAVSFLAMQWIKKRYGK